MSHDHGHRHDSGSHRGHDASARSPGKRTLTDRLQRKAAPVQRRGDGAAPGDVHALAADGTAGPGHELPFLGRTHAFGDHDLGGVVAHTDGAAADRVVAGESAADLLGPAPAATTSTSVQRSVQLDDDIELGPAGPAKPREPHPVGPVLLPPTPEAPTKKNWIVEAAASAMPHVQGVMKAIQVATGIYDKIVGEPVRVEAGETKELEPYIKPSSKEQLDRVLRYKMASMLVTDIMLIGTRLAGLDFSTWRGGLPPAEPTTLAPAAAPAAAQTARMLESQLTSVTLDDLKSRAKIWLEEMIERNTKHLGSGASPTALNKWHWNGADYHAFGEAMNFDDLPSERTGFPGGYDHDHDKRTSATITWYLDTAGVTDGTMAGLPKEVAYFDPMTIEATPMKGLGWFIGGSCGVVYRKAPGDDLKVDINGTKGSPAAGAMGGYHMRFQFLWDNGPTTMVCDVTAIPGIPWPVVDNIVTEGTPET